MTTVFLARHGSHDRLDRILCGRMGGVRLGAAGQAEALALAERLAREPLTAVFASPLERAQETALPIAARHGLSVVTSEELHEIDLGRWTGASFEALKDDPEWRLWNQARGQARPPEGESMLEVQVRWDRWLGRVVRSAPEGSVAAVCHADVIKAALCHALGLSLDHHHRLEVRPGSLSTVIAGAWGHRVYAVNEVFT